MHIRIIPRLFSKEKKFEIWDNMLTMRYRFYTTAQRALDGMRTAILSARSTIALEMYLFENDPIGNEFLSILEAKAAEGVRVFLILDAIGSFGLANAAIERLRAAGAEVRFFSHWFRRTHRKLLIIDQEVIFLGGVNISGRIAPWRDLQVRISGKTIARSALRSFARVYRICGGTDPFLRTQGESRLFKRTSLWFQEHGLGPTHVSLRRHYERHITQAKESIILVTPYFIPRRWLIARLHDAILRGVTVTVIVPTQTDHRFIDRANQHYLSLFARLGARCLSGTEMNHAKVMLIDHRTGTVGSQNLDALSFEWNVEASIFFDDERMVKDLSRIIATWETDATPFHVTDEYRTIWDLPVRIFLGLFGSIL